MSHYEIGAVSSVEAAKERARVRAEATAAALAAKGIKPTIKETPTEIAAREAVEQVNNATGSQTKMLIAGVSAIALLGLFVVLRKK